MEKMEGEDNWFYEEEGVRKGPISEQEIGQLIRSGVMTSEAPVWKKGFANWISVESTDLKVYIDNTVPPPLSGEHVKNTAVWILAFAPLIGTFLEYMLAAMFRKPVHTFWLVTVCLNIGLSVVDERLLQQAGHNTAKYKKWVWLVPVYLYQRAQSLKQNLAYFIVWIVCFVLAAFA